MWRRLTVAWSGEKITNRDLPVQKIIDLIVAHKLNARDRAYVHANKEKIWQVYKKAVPFLVPKHELETKSKKEWYPIEPSIQPLTESKIPETDATKLLMREIADLRGEIEKLKKKKG